jgi:hypothetical protein
MEGLHANGDVITKISVNCVINLHVKLLFTCLFYGFILCVVIIVFICMGDVCICCMYMVTIISV